MKFVEKKCPNCGAGLKFDDNATSVICEYCNKSYYIQRDEKRYAKADEAHLGDAYKFVDEYGKPIVKAFATALIAMSIVPIVIFLIAAIGIGGTIIGFANRPIHDDGGLFFQEEDEQNNKDKGFQEARKKLLLN